MTNFHTTIDKAAALQLTTANYLANPCDDNYWELKRAIEDYRDYYFQEVSKEPETYSQVSLLSGLYTLSLNQYGHLTIAQNRTGKTVYLQSDSDVNSVCCSLSDCDCDELLKGYSVEIDADLFGDYFGGSDE